MGFILSLFGIVYAATSCAVTVPRSVMTIDAQSAPYNSVRPGDTVCVAAGDRQGILEIKNFRGAAGQPITFINSGGKVRIDANRDWVGIYVTNDEYIRITGTGDSGNEYGFEVYNSSSRGIRDGKKTRYIEIDHIEIHNTGSVGIHIGTGSSEITDTNGNGTVRDEWTQYGTDIHHNYLHDIGTEGFYIGSSSYDEGKEPVLEDVEISYNRIERTGWDGLQVGSAIKDVKVHHNTIIDAGLSDNINSGNGRFGMIVNRGTTGEFYNNKIINSRSAGVYIQGIGNYRFYNNLIDTSCVVKTCSGIRWALGNNGMFYNNTIVNTNGGGMTVGSWISGGSIFDNIIAGSTGTALEAGNIQSTNNLLFSDISSAKFVNVVGRDFHLQSSSPAVDKGSASGFAPFDLDDISRPQGGKADIGAYEYRGSTTAPTATRTSTRTPTLTPTRTPSEVPTILPGDINRDGTVNALDYVLLFQSFGKLPGQTGFDPRADITDDGLVNALDYVILFENFGKMR